MMGKNVETLKSMNATTGKFAKWYVRVLDPKVIDYSFQSKGETIAAQRFQCVLVSKDPTQYMLGQVSFTFMTLSRADFNGCPVKSVLLLTTPTTIKAVPSTNKAMLEHPATGLEVSMDISELLQFLKA